MSIIGFPFSMRWPQAINYPFRKNTVDDFRFVLTAYFKDARQSRARTISYRWNVVGTHETHLGDIKAVSLKMGIQLKTLGMLIFPIKILTASASSAKGKRVVMFNNLGEFRLKL